MNKLSTLASGNEYNNQSPDSHVGECWNSCQVKAQTKEWLSPGYLAEAGSLARPEERQEWKHFWGGLGVMLICICVTPIVFAENTFPFICWLQIPRNFQYTLCCTEQNIPSDILFIMLKPRHPVSLQSTPSSNWPLTTRPLHGQLFSSCNFLSFFLLPFFLIQNANSKKTIFLFIARSNCKRLRHK